MAVLPIIHHLLVVRAPSLHKTHAGRLTSAVRAATGATDAARGAADIVLTQPGLSVIVTAIIGARKIFQRMTTYSKYTVAMTFRICFTFGLLTVLYNWYFPTVLIVLLAVFNDGAMIALSKVHSGIPVCSLVIVLAARSAVAHAAAVHYSSIPVLAPPVASSVTEHLLTHAARRAVERCSCCTCLVPLGFPAPDSCRS